MKKNYLPMIIAITFIALSIGASLHYWAWLAIIMITPLLIGALIVVQHFNPPSIPVFIGVFFVFSLFLIFIYYFENENILHLALHIAMACAYSSFLYVVTQVTQDK